MLRLCTLIVASTGFLTVIHSQSPTTRLPKETPTDITAFINVNVIPMDTERVLTNHTVLVEGGRITMLAPASQVTVPAAARRIDGRGKFLMPGLADMHAHLFGYDSVALEHRLLSYLRDGVTTLRGVDFGSRPEDRWEDRLLRFKARAAMGTILSPRLYVSGTWWGDERRRGGMHRKHIPPESTATYLASYKARGFDHVKTYGEEEAVLDSLVAVTHRLGLPLIGHAAATSPASRARKFAAYRSLEHVSGYAIMEQQKIDTAGIRALAQATRRGGIWFCPTLKLKVGDLNLKTNWSDTYRVVIQELQNAGAALLLGTDDFFRSPHGDITVQHELQALVQAGGLTPYQALTTGTSNVADYLGTTKQTGTVAIGKRAELVLFNGNPLEDIKNATLVAGVMLGNRWISQEEIGQRLNETKSAGPASP